LEDFDQEALVEGGEEAFAFNAPFLGARGFEFEHVQCDATEA